MSTTGGLRALVMVSVGGGTPVPVILDTGSVGLRVLSTVIGPRVDHATTTGPTHTVRYGAGPFEVRTVQATVALGTGSDTVATRGPIAVDAIDPTLDHADTRLADRQQARGILGIAPSAAPGSPVLSPLVQLPAPLSAGYTITVPTGLGRPPGTLMFGPPTPSPDTVTVAMNRQRGTYPDGRHGWAKDVPMCWTVAGQHGCGPTDLDTGSGHSVLSSAVLAGAPHPGGKLPTGTEVMMATLTGATLWSYTSTETPGAARPVYHQLFAPTQFNSGIGLYLDHTIAWDLDTGRVLITPRS